MTWTCMTFVETVDSPQASTCANDAVLREGHQSCNSHLARCELSIWPYFFWFQKRLPEYDWIKLSLLTFISSKSTQNHQVRYPNPTIPPPPPQQKPPPRIHGRPWNPLARRLAPGLRERLNDSRVEAGMPPKRGAKNAENCRPYDQGLWKTHGFP